jgi:hypothetical protein
MPAPRAPLALALALVSSAALCSCRTVEGPQPPGSVDAMGRPSGGPTPQRSWAGTRGGGEIGAPVPPPLERDWQWTVDAGTRPGPLEVPGATLAQGLRVAVATDAGLSGLAATHAFLEGVPAPVVVGYAAWPEGASPATEDAQWAGVQVRVEWMVALHARGSCAVDLEAVPRVVHPTGCTALLDEFRFRRTLSLGEALVVGTDPGRSVSRVAAALVGSKDGRGGRFVLRVRP